MNSYKRSPLYKVIYEIRSFLSADGVDGYKNSCGYILCVIICAVGGYCLDFRFKIYGAGALACQCL